MKETKKWNEWKWSHYKDNEWGDLTCLSQKVWDDLMTLRHLISSTVNKKEMANENECDW